MPFVNDTFTDTDATLIEAHAGELGATWAKVTGTTGSLRITSGRAYGSSGAALYYASGSPATAEYDVEAELYCHSNVLNTALCGRLLTTANTHYGARRNAGAIELNKFVAGTVTLLATTTTAPTVGASETIKLEIRDAAKKLYRNGVEILSSTDNAITAAGKAGLRCSSAMTTTTGYHANNFSASDVGGGGGFVPGLSFFWQGYGNQTNV